MSNNANIPNNKYYVRICGLQNYYILAIIQRFSIKNQIKILTFAENYEYAFQI